MKIFHNPSGIYVVTTLFVEHDPLIWLGLRQNGSVLYYDALYHSSLQPFYTQRRVCFTSVYVNVTDVHAKSSLIYEIVLRGTAFDEHRF